MAKPAIAAVQSSTLVEVTMELEKDTKPGMAGGALRFKECDWSGDADDSFIGTLYLRKAKLAGARPGRIRVTIEAE